jgi:hypothetical protein
MEPTVKSIETVARVVAENTIVVAVSRVMMALGVPMILASIFWVSSQIVSLDRRLAVVEEQKPEVQRRLAEAELNARRNIEEQMRQTQRFGQIEAGIASLVANQAATLRSVERIERLTDQARRQ